MSGLLVSSSREERFPVQGKEDKGRKPLLGEAGGKRSLAQVESLALDKGRSDSSMSPGGKEEHTGTTTGRWEDVVVGTCRNSFLFLSGVMCFEIATLNDGSVKLAFCY